MSYMVERRSDSDVFQHWSVASGEWTPEQTIDAVIEPQWDSTLGRLEAVIPISALSSGTPSFGANWADLSIVLVALDQQANAWSDQDKMLLHYRLSAPDQAWLYGNIEQ